jgi:acyl carrier protein
MTEHEAMTHIAAALERVLKKPAPIQPDADLIESGVLDSLDGMSFLLELETATGVTFPDDADLVAEGFYRVGKLVQILTRGR